MASETTYNPPLALTIIAGIFLALGALCFLIVAFDIILRRGWRSMMWIMIPVYTINAAYMLPVTLFTYFKYGRPPKPSSNPADDKPACHNTQDTSHDAAGENAPNGNAPDTPHQSDSDQTGSTQPQTSTADVEKAQSQPEDPHAHEHASGSRPMWATVLIGVSHCGAGCVLGDLVGEWVVYGGDLRINGQHIWVELLLDYAFALFFGIAFQYFSIAPMSGEYGPKTVWRAAKADVLSLTSFEVGAFGWMVIYQVGIWNYQLEIPTWTYWWMMQVGMAMGFATAMPVNYFLITKGIKEPCA